jgi:predicted permease
MPAFIHECLGRLKSLFRKRRMDREMAEELEFHQALLRDKLLRQGIPQSQVNSTVRRTFGNPNRWHERLRELWQFRTIENLLRDITFSIRLLRKSPGFTAIALLTITLGVGANTAVFSLIDSLLLRPLPVSQSDRLVVLGMDQGRPTTGYSFPEPFFRALEKRHDLFDPAFSFFFTELQVRGRSSNEKIPGALVSGGYFTALRTAPLAGRYITPQDDVTGGSPNGLAVVISEGFWQRWFNRSPTAIGSKLEIAHTTFVIVGIMPKQLIGADPTTHPELFLPLSSESIINAPESLTKAGHHAWWMNVMARLKDGVTLDQVNAALAPASPPILHETVPDAGWITRAEKDHFHFTAEPGATGFTYMRFGFRKPLVALFSMCGGILLLACLNLASLLTARGTARERELATRLAMGATRRRLVQQLLVESLLIAVFGTAIGFAIAPVASQSLAVMLLAGNTRPGTFLDTSLDLRVLGFAALVAIVSTMLVGLLPALHATSGNLNEHIKDGQHASTSRRRQILQPIMLASEVGLALILVIGAALLASSLFRLFTSGAGFNPKGVVNISFDTDKQALEGDALLGLYRQLGEGLAHQPGVKTVAFARVVPLTHYTWDEEYSLPGAAKHVLYFNAVGPSYFEAMGIPLLSGRDFQWTDVKSSELKIILNQAAAKLLFENENAVGRHIAGPKKTDLEIIAVVGNAKYEDMRTTAPAAGYLPITQVSDRKPSYNAVVKLDGPAAPIADAARSLAARIAPEIPVPVMTSMQGVIDDSLSTERVMALLSVFFALCALLVTGVGLYGTLAYATARRTSEIGIRMALGAKRSGVVALVLRHNATIAGFGMAAGLVTAILATKALASFLYETSPRDPWILIGSVVALTSIASVASLLPALRAARIEPITAIRYE